MTQPVAPYTFFPMDEDWGAGYAFMFDANGNYWAAEVYGRGYIEDMDFQPIVLGCLQKTPWD